MITHVRILKFSIFFLLSHGASAEQGDPFYKEKLGTCFKDKNQFIQNVVGEYAANDQNLISTKKGSWHWITDRTATENYAWYLLEDRKSLLCWRLFIPAASDVEFLKINNEISVRAVVASKPDLPSKTIYLKQQRNALPFKAYKCMNSRILRHREESTEVPCRNIYD